MKKLATQILLIAVLGLGLGTAALARTPQQPPSPRDTTKYDAWLTQEVHHQLALLPWYSVFDDLSYKVEGTKVTLLMPILDAGAEAWGPIGAAGQAIGDMVRIAARAMTQP